MGPWALSPLRLGDALVGVEIGLHGNSNCQNADGRLRPVLDSFFEQVFLGENESLRPDMDDFDYDLIRLGFARTYLHRQGPGFFDE